MVLRTVHGFVQFQCIGLKMEAGDCPPLNMNAMHYYLL